MADDKSIWKKEITLRKKPKAKPEGTRVPAAPEKPAKPDSVADLLRPLAEQTVDPVILPPVTPRVAGQAEAPLPSPPLAAPKPKPAPEPEAKVEQAAPAPAADAPPVALPPAPAPAPAPAAAPAKQRKKAPKSAPDPSLRPKPPSRRERKEAAKFAERELKEKQKSAAALAKVERKSLPAAHKRVVGLKIGATQIAAAQVVNKNGPRVLKLGRAPLERGIVVGGELREPDELAAALKALFRKHKLPRNCVRLGIANNRIGVRSFEISGIDDPKQLSNAIRFRAQETLPIPLDEAVLDYRILDDRVGPDGVRTRKVLLVVAHRELVDRYMYACRKAGLKLIGIDLEAFALLRALGGPTAGRSSEDAGLVCVTIGHDRSTLAVSNGELCEFTRVLAWGGANLDVALARVLDLTPSEAEPIKHALVLGEEGEGAGLDVARATEARKAMADELQNFARELVASLRFYQEQPGSLGIGEIVITGGGASTRGLVEELERLIGVSVRIGDPLGRVKVPRKLRKAKNGASIGSIAVAVGLGIED